MKKTYVAPFVEIENATASQFIALSIFDEEATVEGGAMVPEENAWMDWSEED